MSKRYLSTKKIYHRPVLINGEVKTLVISEKTNQQLVEFATQVAAHNKLINSAKEELYTAIQALEDGDLPFARSSSTRATGLIVEAHQSLRKTTIVDPIA